MGWFGNICNWVKEKVSDVATWVGERVKETVTTIKSWLGLKDVEYDSSKATPEQTIAVNELLSKYKKEYYKVSKNYDEMGKESLEEQYSQIVLQLKKISYNNDNFIEDYIFENLEKDLRVISEKIDGIYTKKVEEVFSLNNNDLLRILKKPSSDEKVNEIQNMAKNTLINAKNSLVTTLKKFLKEQESIVDVKLEKYLNQTKNAFEKAINDTKTIIDSYECTQDEKIELENSYKKNLILFDLLNKCQEK